MKSKWKNLWNTKKEKALKYFVYFLIFMLFCTIVSRAIYAMRLPKVTVDAIKPGNIEHQVIAEGIVKAKNSKAIWTEADLRVSSVFVKEGESIEAGTPLFQVDTDDLAEKIEELENDKTILQAQIDTNKENSNQTEKDRQTGIDRANEDKRISLTEADAAVTKAQNDLDMAQAELNQYPAKETASDIEKWESEYQILTQTLKAKKEALNTAIENRNTASVEAERLVEDASKPLAADATDTIDKINLEEKQKLLEKYVAIQNVNGMIISETAGCIAKLNVAVGESTPGNAAVVLDVAGDEVDFVAVITKEDKEYLEDGVDIELTFDKTQPYENAKIESVVPTTAPEGSEANLYQLTIELPSFVVGIGKTGQLTATKESELYQNTVPLSAIYSDGDNYYVYIIQTKDTILGEEMVVIQRNVNIIDKNSSLAALDSSCGLTEAESIVINSTRALAAGDSVRLLEK